MFSFIDFFPLKSSSTPTSAYFLLSEHFIIIHEIIAQIKRMLPTIMTMMLTSSPMPSSVSLSVVIYGESEVVIAVKPVV